MQPLSPLYQAITLDIWYLATMTEIYISFLLNVLFSLSFLLFGIGLCGQFVKLHHMMIFAMSGCICLLCELGVFRDLPLIASMVLKQFSATIAQLAALDFS